VAGNWVTSFLSSGSPEQGYFFALAPAIPRFTGDFLFENSLDTLFSHSLIAPSVGPCPTPVNSDSDPFSKKVFFCPDPPHPGFSSHVLLQPMNFTGADYQTPTAANDTNTHQAAYGTPPPPPSYLSSHIHPQLGRPPKFPPLLYPDKAAETCL